ncbi:glycosyltransferase family 4 protein [Siminovitchia fordii]|uniref:glycosyltransferase family 4 protein n=1 Tax=Siminovitchia fordii TaxID=254759 RepID=UPI00036A2E10|nr:glycosyltransferase family 4 protein [Siminovitchia fordii]
MNIWIFNHYAISPASSGGTRHYDLARELVKSGHSVTIFASSFNHFTREETIFTDTDENYSHQILNGVEFVWIRTPSYGGIQARVKNILSYSFKSYNYALKVLRNTKPDLVIGSSVHPLAALVGYKISKRINCLYYFEERDLWPQTFVDFGKVSEKNPVVKMLYKLEKYLYTKADRIIVLFDKAPAYVESKGISKEKVVYIPNGAELNRFKTPRQTNARERIFKGLENKFKIIYLGSHGIANHLDPVIDLIEMLREVEDIHLLMVGDGPEKERIRLKAIEKNVRNVSFHSSVPKEDVPGILCEADLSIISMKDSPLYKWGFSMNKLYDYMAAGLPVMMVANPSTVGNFKEVRGIHASQNLNILSKIIMDYKNDRDKMRYDSHQLKNYVSSWYSWEKLSAQLQRVMEADLERYNQN